MKRGYKKLSYEPGVKFGLLTLIRQLEYELTPGGKKMGKYLFQCECGQFCEKLVHQLKARKMLSCGCAGIKDREERGLPKSVKFVDVAGQKFGRLTAIEYSGKNRHNQVQWLCECECGNTCVVDGHNLKKGHSQSCGCINIERMAATAIHGMRWTSEYSIWCGMNSRCNNPNNQAYKDYGGRGIKVCLRWSEPDGQGFINFYTDMGPRPEGMTLDRVDNNQGYSLENCRWADHSTQGFNQRKRSSNTSGRTGVTWAQNVEKWKVMICVNYEDIYLGCYDSFEEACGVRADAELKYFGVTKE